MIIPKLIMKYACTNKILKIKKMKTRPLHFYQIRCLSEKTLFGIIYIYKHGNFFNVDFESIHSIGPAFYGVKQFNSKITAIHWVKNNKAKIFQHCKF